MFNPAASFKFQKINSQLRDLNGQLYIEHNYSFRGKTNKRYIVILEQYDYHVYAVKFCTHEKKNCTHRFNYLSNLNECSRVITTVGMIMKQIIEENPFASFVIIGSSLPDEGEMNTKRFQLYKRVVGNLIAPVLFEHKESVSKSVYLLINRNNQEPDLFRKITDMFKSIYELSME